MLETGLRIEQKAFLMEEIVLKEEPPKRLLLNLMSEFEMEKAMRSRQNIRLYLKSHPCFWIQTVSLVSFCALSIEFVLFELDATAP